MDPIEARPLAVKLCLCYSDTTKLQSAYAASSRQTTKEKALESAIRESVQGRPWFRRYAKDVEPYTAEQFQQYYYNTWLDEWMVGPPEKKLASDGKDYTVVEFAEYFPSNWEYKWDSSHISTQRKISKQDNWPYTMQGFKDFYADSWREWWAASIDTPCA